MLLCSSAILKIFVEIRKFFYKKTSSALKTKTILCADWNCRKKISDYKKLYSKTSVKPILYQNAVTDNQQIAFVISLF